MTAQQLDEAGNTPDQRRAVRQALAQNAEEAAALLALEQAAADVSARYLRALLHNVLRAMSVRYVLTFGSLEAPADPQLAQTLVDEFVADIDDLRGYDPAASLQPFVDEARGRGVVWGRRDVPAPELAADDIPQPDAITQLLSDIPDNVTRAVDSAKNMARSVPVTRWSDAVRMFGMANQAATSVDRSVSAAIFHSANDAVQRVAEQQGARVLWIAEPDACAVCLALSGRLADPATGTWFDEEATFGRPGSAPPVWPPGRPLMRPPRHPLCRCVADVWWGDVRGPGVVDLPAALRREARRSIVLVRARPSESRAVRIDAAARLLAAGSGLPRSVEDRGRRLVANAHRHH